ncbi:MAG: tetratricopeptide repeat protein, partial [Albidovulum sp.]|nr:tetratricopeptide repeat protein [Albidovulum sp.]
MVWSLVKILVFVVVVAAIGFGASALVDWDADIRIVFASVELTVAPLTMLVAILLLIPVSWLLLATIGLLAAIVRFAVGDDTALTRFFDKSRERRGLESFADGMVALASGEPRVALSKAYRAERNLGKPELTWILSAQAAEEAGDRDKSISAYKKLLEKDQTKFVGLRGILKLKLAGGDTETALKIAEKAFALKPKHEEIQNSLLHLQSKAKDWAGARATLSAKMKSRTLPRNVYSRRDAILALADAKQKIASGDAKAGSAAALAANRAISDFVPAAVLAAEIQTQAGAKRAATRIIRKAWESAPHPDLAAAFAAIEPDESPEQRI